MMHSETYSEREVHRAEKDRLAQEELERQKESRRIVTDFRTARREYKNVGELSFKEELAMVANKLNDRIVECCDLLINYFGGDFNESQMINNRIEDLELVKADTPNIDNAENFNENIDRRLNDDIDRRRSTGKSKLKNNPIVKMKKKISEKKEKR